MIKPVTGRGLAVLAMAGLTSAALSGCSVTASTGTSVKKTDVERQISDQLYKKAGEAPKDVTCPRNLSAKQGTTMRCTMTDAGGTNYGLTVTVTSVKNNTVNFDIKRDSKPTP
ncbi:MAG: DUF4333 domain-containing protein [Mycobacteriales bacterium]